MSFHIEWGKYLDFDGYSPAIRERQLRFVVWQWGFGFWLDDWANQRSVCIAHSQARWLGIYDFIVGTYR